jgi:hypothetical protein
MADSSTDPAHRATEKRVASVYEALGYTTSHNVIVAGQQVDVLAEQLIPGTGMIRVHVEVKTTSKPTLPIDEVRTFINSANALQTGSDIDRSMLVSTAALSPNAYAALEGHPRLDACTLDDLERRVLRFDEGLVRIVKHYGDTKIARTYVDLAVTATSNSPALPKQARRVSDLVDVAVAVPGSAVVLLADYGAGKSTALQHIEADLARRRLEDAAQLVPFFAELKHIENFTSLADFVVDAFRSRFGFALPAERLMELINEGRFVLLLDAFDEITLRGGEPRRAELLQMLAPLLLSRSPAIMTTRPSYFHSRAEYDKALASARIGLAKQYGHTPDMHRRVHQAIRGITAGMPQLGVTAAADSGAEFLSYQLQLLDDAQIDSYLERCSTEFSERGIDDWRDVRSFLDSIYDISDLIARPFLLEMVVQTVLSGGLNVKGQTTSLGAAGLYETYTHLKLEHDRVKAASRREVLGDEDRQQFAEDCAVRMLRTDTLTLDSETVHSLADKRFANRRTVIADVITDLRTCSFMTTAADGSWRFIHRSFQEFFVARRIAGGLDDGGASLLRSELTPETLDFVGSHATPSNDTYERLRQLWARANANDTLLRHNAASAYVAARERVARVDLSNESISGPRRRRLTVSDAKLKRTRFEGVTASDIAVDNCDEMDCTLTLRTPADVRVERSTGTITMFDSPVTAHIENCTSLLTGGERFESLRVVDSDVTIITGTEVGAITLDHASITIAGPAPTAIRGNASTIEIESAGRASIEIAVEDSVVHVWSGERTPISGTVRRSTLVLQPSHNTGEPLPVEAESSVLYCPVGSPTDISAWDIRDLVVLGALPTLSAGRRTDGLTGFCMTQSTRKERAANGRAKPALSWEDGDILIASGSGKPLDDLRHDFNTWADSRARGRRHITAAGLYELLTSHGCVADVARRHVDRIDAVLASMIDAGPLPE